MDFWIVFWGVIQATCVISLFQTMTFFFIVRFDNPGIVDLAWSIGLWVLGFFYYFRFSTNISLLSNIPALVVLIFLSIWMLRLGMYLFLTRIRLGHKDKRYLAMYENWGDNALWMMWLSCQFQGLCQLVLSISFVIVFIQFNVIVNRWLLFFLILLFIVFLCLETLADRQLFNFKKTAGKKSFCNKGLWYYSRHPNYFFEICVWCVIAFVSLVYPFGYIALLGPLFLYLIMRFMTAPITERSTLKRCGKAYKLYQDLTPMIMMNLFK